MIAGYEKRKCSVSTCGREQLDPSSAMGHDWPEQWSQTTSPGCLTAGLESKACRRFCGESGSIVSQPTPAPGHTAGDWVQTTPPTCSTYGEETRKCAACSALLTGTHDKRTGAAPNPVLYPCHDPFCTACNPVITGGTTSKLTPAIIGIIIATGVLLVGCAVMSVMFIRMRKKNAMPR